MKTNPNTVTAGRMPSNLRFAFRISRPNRRASLQSETFHETANTTGSSTIVINKALRAAKPAS